MKQFYSAAIAVFLFATFATAEDLPANLQPLFKWTSSNKLISPIPDKDHPILSVKDPSVVYYDNKWHIYATTADEKGSWHMVYLNFADWSEAASAKPYYLDQNPNLLGYHCAPQVFYFTPHKKWYLIFQSQQPQYSTADDLSKPETWTKPVDFFVGKPASVKDLWIDYWIICDDTHAYLFFTNDNGLLYRSSTPIEQFPKGFSEPVVAIKKTKFELFEGSCTYRIKGTQKYLTLIEAFGPEGDRYYTAYVADKLDGEWRSLADTWANPFAAMTNVSFPPGGKPWTKDISHGELIRDGYDQTLTIDPDKLQLLYQGRDPEKQPKDYVKLPYAIGLLTLQPKQK